MSATARTAIQFSDNVFELSFRNYLRNLYTSAIVSIVDVYGIFLPSVRGCYWF